MRAILQRIRSLIKIARLVSSDDSGNLQQGVFYYMGSSPRGQIFIPYGDLMRPPDNAQMLVLAQMGNESNQIALASDPKNRTVRDLEPGEKGMANYVSGSYILIRNSGDIEIVGTANVIANVTGNVTVDAGGNVSVTAAGNVALTAATAIIDAATVDITGDVTVTGNLVNNGIQFDTHIHSQGNDSNGDAEVDTDGPKN